MCPVLLIETRALFTHLAVLATVIFSSSSKESTRREPVNERRKISYPVSDNPELSETRLLDSHDLVRAKQISLTRLQIENLRVQDGEVFKNAVPHSHKFGTHVVDNASIRWRGQDSWLMLAGGVHSFRRRKVTALCLLIRQDMPRFCPGFR